MIIYVAVDEACGNFLDAAFKVENLVNNLIERNWIKANEEVFDDSLDEEFSFEELAEQEGCSLRDCVINFVRRNLTEYGSIELEELTIREYEMLDNPS